MFSSLRTVDTSVFSFQVKKIENHLQVVLVCPMGLEVMEKFVFLSENMVGRSHVPPRS